MGIDTTDFALLVANSRNGMQMLSLEGGKDLVDNYTQEEIEVEFILNCLFVESKNQR